MIHQKNTIIEHIHIGQTFIYKKDAYIKTTDSNNCCRGVALKDGFCQASGIVTETGHIYALPANGECQLSDFSYVDTIGMTDEIFNLAYNNEEWGSLAKLVKIQVFVENAVRVINAIKISKLG